MSQHLDLSVRQGQLILEIKPTEIHKGGIVPELLRPETDFILAMGDDYTDEDMFAVLPASANTIKVGRGRTMAKFRANNIKAALAVLNQIAYGFWQVGQVWLPRPATLVLIIVAPQRGQAKPSRRNTRAKSI